MKPYSMYANETKNEAPNVSCYYNREYANFTMSWHSHRRVEIMYVKYGTVEVAYYEGEEKKTLTLFNHDYVVIDMDVKHTIEVFSEPTRIINLETEFSGPNAALRLTLGNLISMDNVFAEFFRQKEPIIKLSDSGNVAQLLTVLQETSDRNADHQQDTFINLGLSALFIQISNDYDTQNHSDKAFIKYLRIALQYIHANYHADISSLDIAAHVNISQNYLNRLFKQEFNCTMLEYLNNYRVMKAKLLIEKGSLPFQTVCSQVGFRTKQNFNKNFMRYAGMTPKEYRESVRKKGHTHWTPQSDHSTTIFN